jgi:acyl-CoA synthetase (AMP-forming)/AMP-acid ligase II
MFHIFGFEVSLNLALRAGATVVILPRFELEAFLRAIEACGVTRAEVVPPVALALANSELVDRNDLATLRTLTVGAAPLGADLARACTDRIACRVKQGLGMTELGDGTHIAPDDGPDHAGSIGPALPGVECRVVDPLKTWVAGRVARYKRIRRIEFVERIRRSPSGKILRRQLADRERAARALELSSHAGVYRWPLLSAYAARRPSLRSPSHGGRRPRRSARADRADRGRGSAHPPAAYGHSGLIKTTALDVKLRPFTSP